MFFTYPAAGAQRSCSWLVITGVKRLYAIAVCDNNDNKQNIKTSTTNIYYYYSNDDNLGQQCPSINNFSSKNSPVP